MAAKPKWTKRIVYLLVVAGALVSIAASLKPDPIPVQVTGVSRGALVVTVDGTGKTKWVNKQTLSAPAMGELEKIDFRPGDKLQKRQLVAVILPSIPVPLDARANAEVMARLGSMQAALVEAQRNVERAEIAVERAEKDLDRNRQLLSAAAVAPQAVELSETEAKARRSELELAKASVERIRRESQVVAAPLRDPNKLGQKGPQHVELRSPVDGVVLRVHRDSAGPVQPGAPLIEVGDYSSVELSVELPTQSAMRVSAGARARIDGMGNGAQLVGTVKLVEPAAYTKVTALGVEEQRVNVIIVPGNDVAPWKILGDGFAADTHIEVQRAENVLKVPVGAVFREGSHSAVFRIVGDRVRLVQVETGRRSAEEVELRSGLDESAKVVVHPSDKLKDGVAVTVE